MAVGQESPRAQGEGPGVIVQGRLLVYLRVLLQQSGLLVLLVLAGDFSVTCLNSILLHCKWTIDLE